MNAIKAVALGVALLCAIASAGETPVATADAPAGATGAPADAAVSSAQTPAIAPDVPGTPAATPAAPPAATSGATGAPSGAPETPAAPAAVPAAPQTPAVTPAASPAAAEAPSALPAASSDVVEPPAVPVTSPAVSGDPAAAPAMSPPAAATPADAPPATPPAATGFAHVKKSLVVVKDGIDGGARQAAGFSLSDQGHVLAGSGLLRAREGPTWSRRPTDGFLPRPRSKKMKKTDLMLLRIADNGHGLTALKFARTPLRPAALLNAVSFDPDGAEPFTPVAGSVTQLPPENAEPPLVIHNALFSEASSGTPLLNRCHEAVGVSVLQTRGFPPRKIEPAAQGSAASLDASWLRAFLASINLSLSVADTECLSLEEESRLELARAQREKEAALQAGREQAEARTRALREEAQRREEALNREKEAAQQRLQQAQREQARALQSGREEAEAEKRRIEEEAQRRLEQAQQAQAQALQAERQEQEQSLQAERQQAELARGQAKAAERSRKQVLFYALLAGLVMLLAFILVMRARRRRLRGAEQEKKEIARALDQAQAELSDASEQERLRAGAPDIFIEGVSPQGERIALRVPGVSLAGSSGVVVGRSPSEAMFIINHEQVSRRHFRLILVSQQVMIEDLGSTNGTSVNGLRLSSGVRQPLGDGSELRVGNLTLNARVGA